ncbi:MAG: MarR family transcriptional regulator [Caldilineaceae bacterium]|nr:MarR family transcriptional regulator [Caldilineaceae bacterium]
METETNSQRIGYLLKRAQQALRLAMDEVLRSIGLTTPQYAALAILEESPGISNAELARRAFVTPQTMHQIIFALERAGYVEREQHPHHGRIQQACLTAGGQVVLEQSHEVVDDVEQRLLASLEAEEIPQLQSILQRCIAGLEANAGTTGIRS